MMNFNICVNRDKNIDRLIVEDISAESFVNVQKAFCTCSNFT